MNARTAWMLVMVLIGAVATAPTGRAREKGDRRDAAWEQKGHRDRDREEDQDDEEDDEEDRDDEEENHEDRHILLNFLRERAPDLHRDLEQMKETEPEEYREQLENAWELRDRFLELDERSPDAARASLAAELLEYRSHKIARALGVEKSEERRNRLEADLRKALADGFDARVKVTRFELSELEQEVQRMREWLDRRTQNRNKIIETRFRALAAEYDENLGWW